LPPMEEYYKEVLDKLCAHMLGEKWHKYLLMLHPRNTVNYLSTKFKGAKYFLYIGYVNILHQAVIRDFSLCYGDIHYSETSKPYTQMHMSMDTGQKMIW
jgi:uncharacterized protein YlbG (UPF0298 family)